jgi:hypothetical protein
MITSSLGCGVVPVSERVTSTSSEGFAGVWIGVLERLENDQIPGLEGCIGVQASCVLWS